MSPERLPKGEGPQHHVRAPLLFFIGASPVSQGQWAAVVSAHPDRIHRDLDPNSSFFKGIDLPVESIKLERGGRVSPAACRDHWTGRTGCQAKPNGEYACRAGTVTPFNVGPTITSELANSLRNRRRRMRRQRRQGASPPDVYGGVKYSSGAYGEGPTTAFSGVRRRGHGHSSPNRFGLYDMHAGNVWEYLPRQIRRKIMTKRCPDGSAHLSSVHRTRSGAARRILVAQPGDLSFRLPGGSNVPDDPGWQGLLQSPGSLRSLSTRFQVHSRYTSCRRDQWQGRGRRVTNILVERPFSLSRRLHSTCKLEVADSGKIENGRARCINCLPPR